MQFLGACVLNRPMLSFLVIGARSVSRIDLLFNIKEAFIEVLDGRVLLFRKVFGAHISVGPSSL